MSYLQNLHTHSTFCDGKDTPEEMILAAMKKGFDSIGFSGHSYTYFRPGKSMTPEKTECYKKEVRRLKEKYRGQIDIFCGIELEMYSQIDLAGYDYVIGGLHNLKIGDEYVAFVRPADTVRNVINQHFGGDGMKFARAYYEQIVKLTECSAIDIVGHFDQVATHADSAGLFDTGSGEYQNYALEALAAVSEKIRLFEVNIKSLSQGRSAIPQPAPFLLKELNRRGCKVLITWDCHDSRFLGVGLKQTKDLLMVCGFRESYVLTLEGYRGIKLD
ncbi:MAG: PHP domain-containing protein [Lachnospiraceae bacterium]|nr:PHP domain-containing protein [Lachnospiraceae bacterium]